MLFLFQLRARDTPIYYILYIFIIIYILYSFYILNLLCNFCILLYYYCIFIKFLSFILSLLFYIIFYILLLTHTLIKNTHFSINCSIFTCKQIHYFHISLISHIPFPTDPLLIGRIANPLPTADASLPASISCTA